MRTPKFRNSTRALQRACLSLAFAAALMVPIADADNTSSRDRIRERYFPDVVLTTQTGKQVHLYEDLLKGKIVTINFMYTQCTEGVCPLTTYNLVQARKIIEARVGTNRLGRDIFMYSITLDPEHDTPAALKEYAEKF